MSNSSIIKNMTIKKKMVLSFGIVILALFCVNILSMYKNYVYTQKYKILAENTYKESRLKDLSKSMIEVTSNIITADNQEDVGKFNNTWSEIEQICNELDESIVSEDSKLSYNVFKNVLINTKIDCNNAVIYNKDKDTAIKSADYYNSAEQKAQYIDLTNGELLSNEIAYMNTIKEQI